MNFNEHYIRILNARAPEDLFPDVSTAEGLRKAARKLSAAVHPDANPQNTADAEAAFKRLTTWTERAAQKLQAGTWRDGLPTAEFAFRTTTSTYQVFGLARREALFDSIDVAVLGLPALLHVARNERYETLVPHAVRALKSLSGAGVPDFVECARLRGRAAYVTAPIPKGFVTLASLMEAAPHGIQPAALLPCTYSLLGILARLRRFDLLHGAINPSTWWVDPSTSDSYLTDWHYSVRRGEVIVHQNETYAGLSPWEVKEKRITDRGTDLAAVMLVLREALGTSDIPKNLDRLILAHLCENRNRPSDPVACQRQIRELI
jgi:hypothetical protein